MKDFTARMTADTRALVQQMQAPATTPPPDADPVQLTREGYRQIIDLAGAIQPVEQIETYSVPSANPITLRVYRPYVNDVNSTTLLPAFVYFHGGGFISGDLDTHDRPLRAIANAAGYVVVAVDYRLAPEFPFPAAADDCFTATQWVMQHTKELRINSAIAVGGDSAGGQLATVVSLLCRDRDADRPIAQVLIYPDTDMAIKTASWSEFDFLHPAQSRANKLAQLAMYVPDPRQREQSYASPLRTSDLSGLPPALIITAELDPQRDEGEAYAQRLREAGCLVTHTRYPGVLHGFFQMGGVIAAGNTAIAEVSAYLRLRATNR